MKLTEREKYLMGVAFEAALIGGLDCLHKFIEQPTNKKGLNTGDLFAQVAPKNESIVKKVDADNLPTYEDIFVVVDGELLRGDLELVNGVVIGFFDKGHHKTGITHYIEQKDLIKLITAS